MSLTLNYFEANVNISQYPNNDLLFTDQQNLENNFKKELSNLQIRIMNVILLLASKYETVYVSQKTIARMAGCARETVNRMMPRLIDLGLVNTKYRANHTCLYTQSVFFFDYYVRRALRNVFSAFMSMPVFWLKGFAKFVNVTRLKVRKLKDYINSHLDYGSYCSRKPMSPNKIAILDRMKMLLGLEEPEMDRLRKYTYEILLKSEKRFLKVIESQKVANPKAYFFSICKNMPDTPAKVYATSKYPVKQKPVDVHREGIVGRKIFVSEDRVIEPLTQRSLCESLEKAALEKPMSPFQMDFVKILASRFNINKENNV